ncbi:uncharacterized protein N7483_004393 [Penicillium malachiteum]|uniref:uncharacterized protein n=1 Tax=Penicillium malachiteum TaxID=1324776 RepID=UPI002546B18C|nr:uncharacterized protein N7483_004393 [Penicillium malachiteum]KAJ5729885.1 hypothetical protein N7483_004393 [Penicillium malachiteum]
MQRVAWLDQMFLYFVGQVEVDFRKRQNLTIAITFGFLEGDRFTVNEALPVIACLNSIPNI